MPKVTLNELADFVAKPNGNEHKIQTTVEFSKDVQRIILPEGMSKLDAANDLVNQYNNEEQINKFQYSFNAWDWKDALRAFRNVTEEKFGWIKQGNWATPTEISIITDVKKGVKQMETAFQGRVSFPAWENAQGKIAPDDYGVVHLVIEAKRKFSGVIQTFFKELEQALENDSIYRNKAVTVTWKRWMELEITELKENDKIVLNDKEQYQVDNLIIDQFDDPGKRTYLFTGPYGNAKSETAMMIANKALKEGLSFFYVKNTAAFANVLNFAKKYEPALVFVEDIDEVASGEQRDAEMNNILNTLDGIETKGRNLTVIFTTNHEKRINKALRRPGRIDLLVEFRNPEPNTQEKIFRKYFDKLKGGDLLDYDVIIPSTPDAAGAVIAEMAKRAVKMTRKKGAQITTERVIAAIASMETQIKFMSEDVEAADPVREAIGVVRNYLGWNVDFK